MFQLGEIIPIIFYIEAYGKYTNSSIMWFLIDYSANSSGRKVNIIILIHISIRNLNFTMEKLRKQHIFSFKGLSLIKTKFPRGGNKLLSQLVQFVNVNCRMQAYNLVLAFRYIFILMLTPGCMLAFGHNIS